MKKDELRITIPVSPITKKNSQQIIFAKGRYIPIPSSAYKKFEKACLCHLPKVGAPLEYRMNLCCRYYMPTRRSVDLCNLLAATCDMLVSHQIILDDKAKIVAGHDGSRVLYDKNNPRTEIIITPMEEDE